MSRRPSLIPRDDTPAPAAVIAGPSVDLAPITMPKAASRAGQRAVTTYVSPLAFKQLKTLGIDQDRKLQDLQREAFNLLFEKHGLSRIA